MGRDISHYMRLVKAPSNLTLNTSNDGASTTSLGNLVQCPTTLISNPTLCQFKTSAPCPVTTDLVLKGHKKVSPEPSLLQAEQPQLSQPFSIAEGFQPSDHFRGLLWTRSNRAGRSAPGGSQDMGVEGQNPLPRPAGHAALDAAQDTDGFLGCECTLSAHVQLFMHQYPQVLLLRAALHPFIPQSVWILGIAPTQAQDLALGLLELHEVHLGPQNIWSQLALCKEPASQQGDKDTLQDSEEERGVSSLIVLQQPHSQLEDEAPRDSQRSKPEELGDAAGCPPPSAPPVEQRHRSTSTPCS
ncbi:hypothetical protein QYF61_011622, partial [Mycteria americana]